MLDEVAAFTTHGGALDFARRLYPRAPQPWLDLSTGINAQAYPIGTIPDAAWARLPEARDLARLEAVAARRYQMPPGGEIVAAPGTQALIQRLPVLCKGRDVRVLGPTFGEFERVFRSFDRAVRIVQSLEALSGADVAIVVNPNNPDGRLLPVAQLLALAPRVGSLVVDEAFADLLPEAQSTVPRLPSQRIIVLRSFGKVFGLAGLRLGFAVLGPDKAAILRDLLGPWPVSGPALHVGALALADEAWLATTHERLVGDAARLSYLLRRVGAEPVGGTPLFALMTHPAAPALFTALAQAGILSRPFADKPNWLRFGFPGSEADWARLEAALASFR